MDFSESPIKIIIDYHLSNLIKTLEVTESIAPVLTDLAMSFVEYFDEKVQFNSLSQLGASLAADVTKSLDYLSEAFSECRAFLVMATKCKQPPMENMPKLLSEVNAKILQIQTLEAKSKALDFMNHLKAISALSSSLLWPGISRPTPHIKESIDCAMFYTNRILKDSKGNKEDRTKFVNGLLSVFWNLKAYVEECHSTGLAWNAQGVEASSASSANTSTTAAVSPSMKSENAGGSSSLFASINKGGAITSGLKKVDDSMKNHKNPELRSSGTVAPKSGGGSGGPSNKAQAPQKPPVFILENKRWLAENQTGTQLEIADGDISQTVYISRCTDLTMIIGCKVNSVTVEGCKKTKILLNAGVISNLELINCNNTQVQCSQLVPTVSLSGCHATTVWLAPESVSTEVITCTSTGTNVCLIKKEEDPIELFIPEQFISSVKNNTLETKPVVHE